MTPEEHQRIELSAALTAHKAVLSACVHRLDAFLSAVPEESREEAAENAMLSIRLSAINFTPDARAGLKEVEQHLAADLYEEAVDRLIKQLREAFGLPAQD